jgi:uncharacterized delta-60 repeat protein
MKPIFTFFASLLFFNTLNAQPGTLNRSFGDSGKVLTYYNNAPVQCYASALQSDNKIIAAGFISTSGFDDFLVLRYLPDGALDPSFGANGRVIIDFGYGAERANGVAIQPDGKIVVTGWLEIL